MTWYIKGVDDGLGNGTCKKCGEISSKDFKACTHCCSHKELKMIEEYDNGWGVDFQCKKCWISGIWKNKELIENYKVVRR
jgi:hypothetical protein